jgi:hypothetical protein
MNFWPQLVGNLPKNLFGCAGVLEIGYHQDVLQKIGYDGHRHHVIVAPGRVAGPLQQAFEKYLGYEVTSV